MPDEFDLSRSKIAIIGLGLMGGSLAMGLRGKCAALFGVDPDPDALARARSLAIVQHASSDPASLVPEADLVILAAPVDGILSLLDRLPALTSKACIVLDLGSTKRLIIEAMSRLPDRFDPLGGHPLCGKEKLSLVNAEAGLYRDAVFFLSPLPRTSPRALSAARRVIEAVGAQPVVVDASEHDRMLAFTSHLPFLISSALALTAPQASSSFIGAGFRSTSRLAGTSASMMASVLETNRRHVLAALADFQSRMACLQAALASNEREPLRVFLEESRERYSALTANTETIRRDTIPSRQT